MRRDPNDPFDDIFNEIERMMEDMMGFGGVGADSDVGTETHVDIHEYDDMITVVADLPGVQKDAIEIKCDGRTLSIDASNDSREYSERVRLPARVDEHGANATYNNGVLEVSFDRAEDSADINVE